MLDSNLENLKNKLYEAASEGLHRVNFKNLLEENYATYSNHEDWLYQALHGASITGNLEIVKLVFNVFPVLDVNHRYARLYQQTLVFFAIDQPAIIKYLVEERHAKININIKHDEEGCSGTPLHYACMSDCKKSLETMKILIKNGADINVRSKGPIGNTPLLIASKHENIIKIRLLLINNANVYIPSKLPQLDTPLTSLNCEYEYEIRKLEKKLCSSTRIFQTRDNLLMALYQNDSAEQAAMIKSFKALDYCMRKILKIISSYHSNNQYRQQSINDLLTYLDGVYARCLSDLSSENIVNVARDLDKYCRKIALDAENHQNIARKSTLFKSQLATKLNFPFHSSSENLLLKKEDNSETADSDNEMTALKQFNKIVKNIKLPTKWQAIFNNSMTTFQETNEYPKFYSDDSRTKQIQLLAISIIEQQKALKIGVIDLETALSTLKKSISNIIEVSKLESIFKSKTAAHLHQFLVNYLEPQLAEYELQIEDNNRI